MPGRRHARAIDTLSTFRDEKDFEKGLIVRNNSLDRPPESEMDLRTHESNFDMVSF